MLKLALIALGGAFGAVARFALSSAVQARTPSAFPAGTLAVNVVGCLALGLLLAWIEGRNELSAELRALLAVGVLGSFTTFSTFGAETLDLARDGRADLAALNVGLNVAVGVAAVVAGRMVATRFW